MFSRASEKMSKGLVFQAVVSRKVRKILKNSVKAQTNEPSIQASGEQER